MMLYCQFHTMHVSSSIGTQMCPATPSFTVGIPV